MSARSIALQGIGSGPLLTALQGFGQDRVDSGGIWKLRRQIRSELDRQEAIDEARRAKARAEAAGIARTAVVEAVERVAQEARAAIAAAKASRIAALTRQTSAARLAEKTTAGIAMEAVAARRSTNNRRRAAILAALLLLDQ